MSKDWLTYSGGTDTPGEFCYNFSILNGCTQIVNVPTQIPACDSHSLTLLDISLSSVASICSTMAFPHILIMRLSQFPLTSKVDVPFHCIAYDYLMLIGTLFVII